MTLKTCSCGKVQTTKNAKFIGKDLGTGLYFNCTSCNSTFLIVANKDKKALGRSRLRLVK